MFVLLWAFGSKIVPLALEFLARHDNRDACLLVVLLAVFLVAWAMHQAGLSMALGAIIRTGCGVRHIFRLARRNDA